MNIKPLIFYIVGENSIFVALNEFAMKQLVRYCILLSGMLAFLTSAYSAESQHVMAKRQLMHSGELSSSSFSLRKHHASDWVVGSLQFTSDVKFCAFKSAYKCEADRNIYLSSLYTPHRGYTFSLFGSTDYYVFGLRKIVV